MHNNSFDSPPAAQTGAAYIANNDQVPEGQSPDVDLSANFAGVHRNLAGIMAAVRMVPPSPATPVGNNVIPPGLHVRGVSLAAAAVRTPGVGGLQEDMTNAVAFNQNGQSNRLTPSRLNLG